MKPQSNILSKFQNVGPTLYDRMDNIHLSKVFNERHTTYLNEFTLFLFHFNTIPNFFDEVQIDCKKANKWFVRSFQEEIKDCYYDKRYFNRNKHAEYDDIFYFLYDDLIVNFDTNCSSVKFLFRKTDINQVEEIILSFEPFQGKYIKTLPLHETQQVIVDDENELQIRLKLYLTHDLVMELLSYGSTLKVIKPKVLADLIRAEHYNAHTNYN